MCIRDSMKLTPAEYPVEGYRGSCLKGLAYIERIYSQTRVKYPMRRVGERGADQWEQISWDEAIQEIASKFTEISEKYGPKAVVFDSASGQYGFLNGIYNPLGRLSGVMGATKLAVSYDYACLLYTSHPRPVRRRRRVRMELRCRLHRAKRHDLGPHCRPERGGRIGPSRWLSAAGCLCRRRGGPQARALPCAPWL